MLSVQYATELPATRLQEGIQQIFDPIRKKWLVCTPEEWVRQCFLLFLTVQLNYPISFIAVEKEIWVGERKKRFDLLVYDKHHQPFMMIECKAPSISLQPAVLEQLLRYHLSIPVPYLIITNGPHTKGFWKNNAQLLEMQDWPSW